MICFFLPINDWAPDAYATTVKAIRPQIDCRDEFTTWVQMLIFSMSFGSQFHTSRGGKSWYRNVIVTMRELPGPESSLHSQHCEWTNLSRNGPAWKIQGCKWVAKRIVFANLYKVIQNRPDWTINESITKHSPDRGKVPFIICGFWFYLIWS